MQGACDISKTIHGALPRIPFEKVKNRVLGTSYELSVVIMGDALAKRLNTEHRNKTYATNVLAFPLSESEGEIFLNLRKAEREARTLGISTKERVLFLFVHALLHLKGYDHGSKMERLETQITRQFSA